MEIQKTAAAFGGNHFHGAIHLFVAVAGKRVEDMSGQAMRLNADQDVFAVFDTAPNQGDVALLVQNTFKHDHAKIAMGRR